MALLWHQRAAHTRPPSIGAQCWRVPATSGAVPVPDRTLRELPGGTAFQLPDNREGTTSLPPGQVQETWSPICPHRPLLPLKLATPTGERRPPTTTAGLVTLLRALSLSSRCTHAPRSFGYRSLYITLCYDDLLGGPPPHSPTQSRLQLPRRRVAPHLPAHWGVCVVGTLTSWTPAASYLFLPSGVTLAVDGWATPWQWFSYA